MILWFICFSMEHCLVSIATSVCSVNKVVGTTSKWFGINEWVDLWTVGSLSNQSAYKGTENG
jgi:hypothetical protein